MENKNEFIKLYCPGCGALLQNDDPLKSGFVPKKLEAKSNFLCQRCFRLQHYGEAYEDIHYSNDYQTIISKAKQSDALIVYVVDLFAFDCSIINSLITAIKDARVAVICSKRDVIPSSVKDEKLINCKDVAYKYSKLNNCRQELVKVKNYWKDILGKVQVYTPLESTNILLNGWAMYQTIVSRLLGRSGYYQSGGAFGFRDQLQDTLGLKYLDYNFMKNQIIKHSKHQFKEGDVEHWWHDETKRGIRTRFSDDLLWLVFLVIEYINFTGDKSILDIETPFLEGEILQEGIDEKYDKYEESNEKARIYEHCIKAIEKSLNFGENGMPKIGSGDWNDGFSTVGNKGKGESVWLGFFLYYILDKFIPIIKEEEKNREEKSNQKEKTENDNIGLVEKYEKIKQELKRALNMKGWDGRWYKRAFMDDGNVLGTMENDECRIDSIAQSWSVISNAGDNDKKYISMESLENHLVDKENGIIKLLDPPFEKGKLEPGYIKAYMPGVRENGGQYTHVCCC